VNKILLVIKPYKEFLAIFYAKIKYFFFDNAIVNYLHIKNKFIFVNQMLSSLFLWICTYILSWTLTKLTLLLLFYYFFALEGIARLFWVMSQFLVKSCG